MPDKAKKGSRTGDIVRACDCQLCDKDLDFYCVTEGCNVVMSLVSAVSDDAHFRRRPSSPYHISVNCMRGALIFNPHKYVEKDFDKDSSFEWMFTPVKPRKSSKKGTRHVRNRAHNSLRTLGNLYKMCISKRKDEDYNGFTINDIFADAENFATYGTDLNGQMIVECSFYKKVYNKPQLLFNYPTDFREPHVVLRVNFDSDKEKAWWYRQRLNSSHHTEPVIGDPEVQFECDFSSTRQIYIVK